VAGYVADDQPDAPAVERERVVEVSAGSEPLRWPVGDRGAQAADRVRDVGEERSLQDPDLAEQGVVGQFGGTVASRGPSV